MAKDDNQTLTPSLRFPGFRAPWEEIPLKELADLVSDRVGSAPCTPYTVTSGVGLVSQAKKFGRTIAGNSLKNYIRLQKNDFAYNKSSTKAFPEGYIARYLDDAKAAVPNSIFTCFRADESQIDSAYLEFLFASNLHGRWLRKFLTIGARSHGSLNVSDDDLMALPVPIPSGSSSFAEQRKIADCLTSLDQLAAAQGRKVEALKAHKKALMQRLFPGEGESLPRLRFPAFSNAGKWKRRTIRDLLEKASRPVEVERNEIYREIGVRSHGKGIFHKEPVTGRAIGTKRVFWLVPDAFILNIIFAWEQAVAFTTKNEAGMIASHRFPMYLPRSSECDVRFLMLAFLTPAGKRLLGLASPGGAGRNRTLGQDEFEKLEIIVPEGDEQTSIQGAVLSAEAVVATETEKLGALKAHRKGLLQQLFPPSKGIL